MIVVEFHRKFLFFLNEFTSWSNMDKTANFDWLFLNFLPFFFPCFINHHHQKKKNTEFNTHTHTHTSRFIIIINVRDTVRIEKEIDSSSISKMMIDWLKSIKDYCSNHHHHHYYHRQQQQQQQNILFFSGFLYRYNDENNNKSQVYDDFDVCMIIMMMLDSVWPRYLSLQSFCDHFRFLKDRCYPLTVVFLSFF